MATKMSSQQPGIFHDTHLVNLYPILQPLPLKKLTTNIMTRLYSLPTKLILEEGSIFVSNMIHKIAEIFGITFCHAVTKHAQTISVPEILHVTVKLSVKKSSGVFRRGEVLYLDIPNYNTKYHTSNGFQPSRQSHRRVPSNILDHKLGLKSKARLAPTTDFAEELLRKPEILYDETK